MADLGWGQGLLGLVERFARTSYGREESAGETSHGKAE